jgi:hypothetical protein
LGCFNFFPLALRLVFSSHHTSTTLPRHDGDQDDAHEARLACRHTFIISTKTLVLTTLLLDHPSGGAVALPQNITETHD